MPLSSQATPDLIMTQPTNQSPQRQPATGVRPALDPSFVECMSGLLSLFPNDMDVQLSEVEIEGLDNNNITLAIFRAKNTLKKDHPVLYFTHPGGQIAGDRFTSLHSIIEAFQGIETVFVSVEYRLAPEHPAPAALNDAYAGLNWVIDHTKGLGIDATKIILGGVSGGGAIAAGCAMLYNKKRSNPPLLGVLLSTPMLDDRDCTVSSRQFVKQTLWSGDFNRMAWGHVLGDQRGGPDVSEFVAPARAENLTGFPPTFIDAGSCEVFRDEAVAFALQLWKDGMTAELHIWPGGFHGFDELIPEAPVSQAAKAAKALWVKRLIQGR
ncbi:hypothetical protein FOVG_02220 [Fusarium oxysporum f. sp. pisi HDV247]|uniref:Alpha/beta hydrolase fold-3 domain-containing protein n=1 Tax=Fusarium oxysporum f. sp. pisi HDV247 TaxID=1080344 RepID=W9Q0W6_FUSOX|nr:hypothetical protein FOVG_02220 [Fusarium oxysporum f. sp. pisi HDV247]